MHINNCRARVLKFGGRRSLKRFQFNIGQKLSFSSLQGKGVKNMNSTVKQRIKDFATKSHMQVREVTQSITKESVFEFSEYFFRVLVFASIAYIFTEHVAYVTLVMGPSMLETFNVVGDLLIVEALTPLFRGYRVGDVVVAKSPTKQGQYVVKRVRAIAGDVVNVPRIRCSRRDLLRSTSFHKAMYGFKATIQETPNDSRDYGPVPLTLLKYRALCRVYPNPFIIKHEENETLPGTTHHFADIIKNR